MNQTKKRFRKALAALLCLVMTATLCKIYAPQEAQAEGTKDAYGFDTNIPEDFDPTLDDNPYGEGRITVIGQE